VQVDGRRCRLDDVLGPDWALLTAGGPELPPPVADPVRVVRLGSGAGEVRSPELAAWLGGRSVLVRPDRIVAAVSSA
jgi:3-(3-hydroxy-phenyl)propionate hydroxylase